MTTVVILTLCFLTALSCKIKKVKAPVTALICWYLHLFLACIAAACILMWIGNYGFKGAHTERVLLSLYAGSGMIVYGISPREISGKRVYLLLFFAFPFFLLAGLLLPPTRIFTVIIAMSLLADGNVKRYPVDDDHYLQTFNIPIVNRYPDFSIVEDKYWLFEKTTPHLITRQILPQEIRLQKINTDSVKITLWGHTAYDTILPLRRLKPTNNTQ